MARYEHLPIWHAAMTLSVAIEGAVAQFSRYHKYALGTELRRGAQAILGRIVRAARASTQRVAELESLVLAVEHLKGQLTLARELRCCSSFTVWAELAELAVGIGKQSEGWFQQARRVAAAGPAGPSRTGASPQGGPRA
jgi:hypothetical protein